MENLMSFNSGTADQSDGAIVHILLYGSIICDINTNTKLLNHSIANISSKRFNSA